VLPDEMPKGVAVGIVDLVGCRPTTANDSTFACFDVVDGEFAWLLANARKIEPLPVKGRLGIFSVRVPECLI
jgi:hypothetical protein